jgi:TolB-like protein/DNA-binding winged helix-turn-helix (wHTH) protein/cytochrome c-type biogenesis protein CcmH/NrfG
VPLPPKDVEVLIVLVERAGHIVEKDELLEKVWPGVFIEEGNLSRRVFNLRQVLGDGEDGQKYIETVPRRGYRFIATVQKKEEAGAAPISTLGADAIAMASAPARLSNPPTPAARRLWFWPLALTAVLAVTATLSSQHFLRLRTAGSQKVMLAVLPFANLSGEPNTDYFADGFTEEMITQLGQVQPAKLGVIARTSAMQYKNTKASAAKICQELGVNYMLEGSVRQAGDRVRITAQLIQGSDQTHLWAESYDAPLTDVLRVQQEIAGKITNSLRMELLASQSNRGASAPLNPEAYRKYLLGLNELHTGTREGLDNAIQHFQEAIAAEPGNGRYYAVLAEAYASSVPYFSAPSVAMPLAKQAAEKALQLDPTLAIAHSTLGDARLLYDWDWNSAKEEYSRALAINPSSSEAHLGYATYFSTLGRVDDAIAEVQQVYRVDPIAVDSRQETIWVYLYSGSMEQTAAQARKTIELEPKAGYAHGLLALAYANMGRHQDAVEEAETADRVSEDTPGAIAVAISALARVGEREKAHRLLNHALDLAQKRYICRFLLAAAYVDLDEKDKAIESLQRGIRDRST